MKPKRQAVAVSNRGASLPIEDIIYLFMAAFERKDRGMIDAILAADFTFTTPDHARAGRKVFFRDIWPTAMHSLSVFVERVFAQGDEAFVQYTLEQPDKTRMRKVVMLRFRDSQITHADVYLGRPVPGSGHEDSDEHA